MEDLLKYIKDPAMIAGIIGLTEAAKSFIKVKNRKLLVLIPIFLGLVVGSALNFPDVKLMVYEGFKYAGFASLAYQFYRNFFVKDEKNVPTNKP